MPSRRLTKSQKVKILEAFRLGKTTLELSQEFNCSSNTVIRTVKALIPEDEYSALKEERAKESNTRLRKLSSKSKTRRKNAINEIASVQSSEIDSEIEVACHVDSSIESQKKDLDNQALCKDSNKEISRDGAMNGFEEITPLISSFGFDTEKQKVSCQSLGVDDLPECVYMLVDKKVELDTQQISELPEWNFLPDSEKERQALLLFADQRSAKRNCSRNQRVIKIPNTNVFNISKQFLVSKGITRLILDDSLIGLDLK